MAINCDETFTAIPNNIMAGLIRTRIPGESRQILDAVFRKTFGWAKEEDGISLTQFQKMTGLGQPNVCRAIKRLVGMGILIKNTNAYVTTYAIEKDHSRWNGNIDTAPNSTCVETDTGGIDKTCVETDTGGIDKTRVENDTETSINIDRYKRKKENIYILDFEKIWAKYPNKDGKKVALKHFKATVRTDEDLKNINKALDNYLVHLKAENWKSPKNGSTWFNNWQDWVNWVGKNENEKTPTIYC